MAVAVTREPLNEQLQQFQNTNRHIADLMKPRAAAAYSAPASNLASVAEITPKTLEQATASPFPLLLLTPLHPSLPCILSSSCSCYSCCRHLLDRSFLQITLHRRRRRRRRHHHHHHQRSALTLLLFHPPTPPCPLSPTPSMQPSPLPPQQSLNAVAI